MASVNKVILVGHLGRDPEVRSFPSGDRVANVAIATTETWKDKQSGERRESTEWHRIVFRGGLAGIVEQYLRKGSQIYVEGSIRSRKYNDAQGVEKSITEIQASEMRMLGGPPGSQNNQGDGYQDDGYHDNGRQQNQGGGQQRGGGGNQGNNQRGGGQQHGNGGQNGGRGNAPPPRRAPSPPPPPRAAGGSGFDDMDDDIPFNDPLKRRAFCLAI